MSVSTFSIQLPAGSSTTELINLPTTGAWVGAQLISIATLASTTITATAIKMLPGGSTSSRVIWNNITIAAERKRQAPLFVGETMIKFTYTSTEDISFGLESNTNAMVSS